MSEFDAIGLMPEPLAVGEPLRDRFGICCRPALHSDTDGRYALKVISVPDSQVRVEALILAGVVKNELKAQDHFKKQADALIQEVRLLDKLSKVEGFLPFQAARTVKMREGVGYEVELLAPFRQSLAQRIKRRPLSQTEAVNLGLDLCAALTACRRMGYLYVNLKPSNIFLTENRGFCIGDLGFVRMASLAYASFPDKYRSVFTPPEIQDAMSSLNETVDVFALGMTLYQVYNNGQLPFEDVYPDQPLPPPYYADYELAQIILKACAPVSAERWQTPAEMGKALVDYMQRNGVEDVSIIPEAVVLAQDNAEPEEFLSDEENNAELSELLALIPEEDEVFTAEEAVSEEAEPSGDDMEKMLAQADALIEHQLPEPVMAPDPIEVPIPPPIVQAQEPEAPQVEVETVAAPMTEEAPPVHNEQEKYVMEENKEKSAIPTKLIVRLAAVVLLLVAVGAFGLYYYKNIYIQTIDKLSITNIEDQIVVRVETNANQENLTVVCTDAYGNSVQSSMTSGVAQFNGMKADTQYRIEVKISGNHKLNGETTGTITTCKQTHITGFKVESGEKDGSVLISFDVVGPDSEKWNVEYYANHIPSKVATFNGHSTELTDLTLGVNYTFRLYPVDSLYLAGDTRVNYMPGEPSTVSNFKALAGEEVGTVTLSFDVTGPDSARWNLEYAPEGGEPQVIGFEGHSVELSGLEMGVSYTFRLEPMDKLYLTEEPQLTYTVLGSIVAENLRIPADRYFDRLLHAQWSAPDGAGEVVWVVRCQSNTGYDQTIETTDNSCIFSLPGDQAVYTVTVTAQGFTESVSATTEGMTPHPSTSKPDTGGNDQPVNPNPGGSDTPSEVLRVTGFKYSFSVAAWYMELSWDYIGTAPSGWILTYTTNGGRPITVRSKTNSTIIYVESNSEYVFEVRPVDDVKYDSVSFSYTTQEHDYYNDRGFNAEDAAFELMVNDTTATMPTVSASDVLYLYYKPDSIEATSSAIVNVTFSIRNAENIVVSAETVQLPWKEIWANGECKLQIPTLPKESGNYVVDLFFDYFFVADAHFIVG